MEDLLGKYPAIKKIFGEEWLNDQKNQNHPIFGIGHEIQYLTALDKYLRYIRTKKRTRDQLRNSQQFWDVYYEFEIAYFLRKLGLDPKLHEKICGVETDIFLEKENIVVEIKHLHIPYRVEKETVHIDPNVKSHPAPKAVNMTFHNMERMQSYLESKNFQNVYPNIVCFCPDISAGDCDDLKNLLESYNITENISILAIWRHQKIHCFFENPNGKKFEWKSVKLKNFLNSICNSNYSARKKWRNK